jgi:hypothetical protein
MDYGWIFWQGKWRPFKEWSRGRKNIINVLVGKRWIRMPEEQIKRFPVNKMEVTHE